MKNLIEACLRPEDNMAKLQALTECRFGEKCLKNSPLWLKIFCALCLHDITNDQKPTRMILMLEFVDRYLICLWNRKYLHHVPPISAVELPTFLQTHCIGQNFKDDWICLEQRKKNCFIVDTENLATTTHYCINLQVHWWFKKSFNFVEFVLNPTLWPTEITPIKKIKKEKMETAENPMPVAASVTSTGSSRVQTGSKYQWSLDDDSLDDDSEDLLLLQSDPVNAAKKVIYVDVKIVDIKYCITRLNVEIKHLCNRLQKFRWHIRTLEMRMVQEQKQLCMPYILYLTSSPTATSRSFLVDPTPEILSTTATLLFPENFPASILASFALDHDNQEQKTIMQKRRKSFEDFLIPTSKSSYHSMHRTHVQQVADA
jgi:hypothetical protein